MPAKNLTTTSNIVELRGQHAFTNSLVVAEQCGLMHATVLKSIRKYKTDFEEFGRVGFEIRPFETSGGAQDREIAILNEDQATYLITLSRNTPKVRQFKIALVKAFRKAVDEINRLYANPPRSDILRDKRHAHNPMMDALIEHREDLGKGTEPKHFMCENRLCNWAVTGEFKKVNEKELNNEEVSLLLQVRKRNEAYLLADLDYQTRKGKLLKFAMRRRTKLIGSQAPVNTGPSTGS